MGAHQARLQEGQQPSIALRAGEVHVWLTDPANACDPGLLRQYHALMNDAERRKHDRYRVEKSRHACLVTRALVRTTLSRYWPDVEPAAWRFVEVGNGRPELAAGQTPLALRFNVSRTDGLIACGVTLERSLGIDVERLDPRLMMDAIAESQFAPTEVDDLRQQPAERQSERFFSYWTLKESYIKARGLGLAIPLREFAFVLDDARPIQIVVNPRLADPVEGWQFALERPTPHHLLAVGTERRGVIDLQVQIRSVLPLQS